VLVTANANGAIQHWHVTSRKCMHTISEKDDNGKDNQVYALDYRHDGALFASAGKDFVVRVYDEATKSVSARLAAGWVGAPSAGHSNRIFSLKFVPDEPNLLLSGGWDNTVQIWDLRQKQPTGSIYGPHVCGDSIDVSGHEVVTGSWRPNHQLQIWDIRTRELLHDVPLRPGSMDEKAEACHLYAAQFSKPGSAGPRLIAAGGSTCNEMRLLQRESLATIGRVTLPRGVYGLDLSADGSKVAVAGGDCKVRVMAVPGVSASGGTKSDSEAAAAAVVTPPAPDAAPVDVGD
jgi:COMPASS component SWD3